MKIESLALCTIASALISGSAPGQCLEESLVLSTVLGEDYGWSTAMDGDTLVVGAPDATVGGVQAGAAYVHGRDQGGPGSGGLVARLTASDFQGGDGFGCSVAIHGDTVVVGAPQEGPATGAAYVFERDAGGPDAWGETRKVVGLGLDPSDEFGTSVSVHMDTLAVGAIRGNIQGVNPDVGAVHVFYRDTGGPGTWGQVAERAFGANHDQFGFSVSVWGSTLAVGAPLDDQFGVNSGAAYVLERDLGGPDQWGLAHKLEQPMNFTVYSDDRLGESVLLVGDQLFAGAPNEDTDGYTATGSVHHYRRDKFGPGQWGQVEVITAPDRGFLDRFGHSLAYDGNDRLLVGAPGEEYGTELDDIEGLAHDPVTGLLLAVDGRQLLTIDPSTLQKTSYSDGIPINVGSGLRSLAVDVARGVFYSYDKDNEQLITIDRATGAFSYKDAAAGNLRSLAYDEASQILYGASNDNNVGLVTIDVSTGGVTIVASLTGNYQGMTFEPTSGRLLATRGGANSTLESIDPATGVGTPIGGPTGAAQLRSLALDPSSGTLYAVSATLDELYELDAGGIATSIGPLVSPPENLGAVYVFDRPAGSNGGWAQSEQLRRSAGAPDDQFGWAVTFEGESIWATALLGDAEQMDEGTAHLWSAPAPTSYCTAGTTTNGCTALISATGTASASQASGFDLTVAGVEGQKSGLIYFGTSGPKASPWGAGTSFACVKGPQVRTPVQLSGGTAGLCDGALTLDFNAWMTANPTKAPAPGEEVFVQGWFRDPPAPKGTSLSDALQLTVCP